MAARRVVLGLGVVGLYFLSPSSPLLLQVSTGRLRTDPLPLPEAANRPRYVAVSSLRPDALVERWQPFGGPSLGPPVVEAAPHADEGVTSPALAALAVAVGFLALGKPRRTAALAVKGRMSRRNALAAAGAALLAPRAANAAYGPSGAAIRSDAPIKGLALEDFLELDPAKRKQRSDAFTGGQIADILNEIEARRQAIVDELQRNETQQTEASSSIDQARLAFQNALQNAERIIEGQPASSPPKDDKIKFLEEQEANLKKKQTELGDLLQKLSADTSPLQSQLKAREQILQKLDDQPPYVSWGAAALGAVISTLVMHPIDTVKTMKIANAEKADGQSRRGGDVLAQADAAALTFSPATLPKLYKGVTGNIVKEGPSSAFYLGVYELVKARLLTVGFMAPHPIAIYLISGGVGEVFASTLRAPAEAIKSTVQTGQAENAAEGADILFSDPEKRANVLRAWTASLWRDVPMGAIQIALFEGLKVYCIESPNITFDVDSLMGEAALGAFGGAVAALVTTPPDVLTTLIITEGDNDVGAREMLSRVLEKDGIGGLFTGATERVVYWGPAIGIFLSSYCSLRQFALTHGL